MKKDRYFIWALPIAVAIIVILLHIISFIYDYRMLKGIYELITTNGYNNELFFNLDKFLKTYDNQYLITGMEIVGLAISVWIGLNIYNIVKRDSIKELETTAIETKSELEEFRDQYKFNNLSILENANFKEERINNYLVIILKKYGQKVLDYKSTQTIIYIEKTMQVIIKNLEIENYYAMKDNLKIIEKTLAQFKDEKDTHILVNANEQEKKVIETYLQVRYGDYNYYMGLYYFRNKKGRDDLSYAKYYLERAYDDYNLVKTDEEQLVKTYINNVQSYICNLLYHIIKEVGSKEEKETNHRNIEKALEHSMNACTTLSGTPYETKYARDHRNYGVNIESALSLGNTNDVEWFEEMLKALNQYKKALKFDKNDINTLTSIASCILKIYDRIIRITEDEEDEEKTINKLKDLQNIDLLQVIGDFTTQNPQFKGEITIDMMNMAYNSAVKAQIIKPYEIASHYHLIHIYLYKIMMSKNDSDKKIFIDKVNSEIITCESLYNISTIDFSYAFLFKARNFCFSINDEQRGKYYYDLIKSKRNKEKNDDITSN